MKRKNTAARLENADTTGMQRLSKKVFCDVALKDISVKGFLIYCARNNDCRFENHQGTQKQIPDAGIILFLKMRICLV
ncbi:MAG: hypothetical protein CVU71_18310 [Deltaproteobacteria bacterium HGW-Deltaproteobacteria-6]|jgi:hypothetical protein|nr:MAG: hypothetical protein CVU71_18310 [Deltaproteobacteria bacterium HGW-Deltaproteobacteria-6]